MNRWKSLPKYVLPLVLLLSACGRLSSDSKPIMSAMSEASVLSDQMHQNGSASQNKAESSSGFFASNIFKVSLQTSDGLTTPVKDLILESDSWRGKYWIVTEKDGDLIPVPWSAANSTELALNDQTQTEGRFQVSLLNVSTEVIRVAPSFRPEDVKKLKKIDPQALDFLGLSDWDKKAREYWKDYVDLNRDGSSKAAGLPILLSELIASSKSGVSVVNKNGDLLGKFADFIIRADGQVLYLVVDVGTRLIPVPTEFVKLDINNKRFLIPVTKEVMDHAVGFEQIDAFPDLSEEKWDQTVLDFWNGLTK